MESLEAAYRLEANGKVRFLNARNGITVFRITQRGRDSISTHKQIRDAFRFLKDTMNAPEPTSTDW